MSAEPVFEPDRVVAALNEAGVHYVVVGGLAVGAHGVVRATRHGEVQLINRMRGVPSFEDLQRDQIRVEIASDAIAPVCSLAHLREMKRAAGRPRDRVDLAELAEVHGPG